VSGLERRRNLSAFGANAKYENAPMIDRLATLFGITHERVRNIAQTRAGRGFQPLPVGRKQQILRTL
jgi:hypothetical protein